MTETLTVHDAPLAWDLQERCGFATDFEYPRDVHVLSMCRQISNCADRNGEALVGTKGNCQVNAYRINDKQVISRALVNQATEPYVQEHTDLIESIRKGEPINELKNVAESTLTAIMGRMASYTGQLITWEAALNSMEKLMPEQLTMDMPLPVAPVAMPGKTKFV